MHIAHDTILTYRCLKRSLRCIFKTDNTCDCVIDKYITDFTFWCDTMWSRTPEKDLHVSI